MFYNYHEDYQYDSCISKGICSINPRTSSLREVLVMYLKQLAFYTLHLKYLGLKNRDTEDIILNTLSGLMSNLETGNKQFYQTLINLKSIIIESIETYKRVCSQKNIKPKEIKTNLKLNKKQNITDLIQLGEKEFSKKLKQISEKKRNLYEIIFLVLKSICINLVEIKSFGEDDNCAYSEILYLLNTINFPELSQKILIKKINLGVKIDFYLTQKLNQLKTENYGLQTEANISYTTYMKKAILVLMAVLSLAFTSCFKESQYSITYIGEETDVANVTLFEYDYAYNLVAQREVKLIKPNNIYEITSSDLADYVVVGVEGTIYGKIIEWYCQDIFELDNKNPIHIDISFTGMNTQNTNPVNPSDGVTHYLRD